MDRTPVDATCTMDTNDTILQMGLDQEITRDTFTKGEGYLVHLPTGICRLQSSPTLSLQINLKANFETDFEINHGRLDLAIVLDCRSFILLRRK